MNNKAKQEFKKYMDWANNEIYEKNNDIMVETDHIHPNGSITKIIQSKNFTPTNDRIDGHFWLEDMNGRMISDCGLNSYKHNLPCFQNDGYYNPDTDFIVYQPVPCPKMEQQIIDGQVARIKASWGRSEFVDADEHFKATARQMWKEKDRVLKCFKALEYSICEHLHRTEKGEVCRIRFGCAGVAYPKRDKVFWFFGHLDNTKIGEWIVEDAVSADGNRWKPITHDRRTSINEVPNAVKEIKNREIKQKVSQAAEELLKQKRLAEEQKRADKAVEELLAMEENKKPAASKKKKNKK